MGKMLGLGARNALSGHPSPTRDANRDSGGLRGDLLMLAPATGG